jgi:hypothetical protein
MNQYPHAPQLPTDEELTNWVKFFSEARASGANLDVKISEPAWKIEGFVMAIEALRQRGFAVTRPGGPSDISLAAMLGSPDGGSNA